MTDIDVVKPQLFHAGSLLLDIKGDLVIFSKCLTITVLKIGLLDKRNAQSYDCIYKVRL